jgi:SAM-dependent methyltransferase
MSGMRELWDGRYSEPFSSYGTAPNDFLREAADRIPSGPVLCLAEGEGRNAVHLALLGHAVTAVDLSPVGLANAKALAGERGVEIETVVADLAGYDPGVERWAGIVSTWSHLPPAIRGRLYPACVEALRPGGALVLEAYTPRQLERSGVGGPSDPTLLATPGELRRAFAGLDLERCTEVRREVHEGRYHHGASSTVQLLGFKPSAGTTSV